jgi:hypothetical protein
MRKKKLVPELTISVVLRKQPVQEWYKNKPFLWQIITIGTSGISWFQIPETVTVKEHFLLVDFSPNPFLPEVNFYSLFGLYSFLSVQFETNRHIV